MTPPPSLVDLASARWRRRWSPWAAATACTPRCPRCGCWSTSSCVDDLTAVVTVADNGGSSGRLRGEFGVLPPGDLRMALAALCGTDDWGITWSKVLQHRFAGDGRDERPRHRQPAHRRPVGAARRPRRRPGLRRSAARGDRSGAADGTDPDGHHRRGPRPACPATPTRSPASAVRSRSPPPTGSSTRSRWSPPTRRRRPAALEAIAAADWVVLGPGSWFTSVIPHLLVPGAAHARSSAPTPGSLVVLNLVDEAGETPGFGPADHLAVLAEHAPELKVHTVLVDSSAISRRARRAGARRGGVRRPARGSRRRREPRQRPPRSGQAGRGVRRDHGVATRPFKPTARRVVDVRARIAPWR